MSHVAPSVAQEDDAKSTAWRYAVAGARDLRIDFMRGIALVMMVVAHTEVMSVFNIFSWERFGLTTGAEGFVILSGFMLGMLNRARLQKVVLLTVSWGLYLRAWKIYRVNIIIIVSFILLAYIPHINVFEVTHFTDRFSGESWSLYPVTPQIKETWFNIILYLQIGPHQTQILGLYIFLLLLSPLFLGMLQKGKVWWLLGLSLLVYSLWQRWPLRLTPSEFEFAFPLLARQFIFVLGMASGWYKAELLSFARTPPGKGVVVALVMVSLVLGFVAQNHTNPFMPTALLMHIIPPDSFNSFYHTGGEERAGPGEGVKRYCPDGHRLPGADVLLDAAQSPAGMVPDPARPALALYLYFACVRGAAGEPVHHLRLMASGLDREHVSACGGTGYFVADGKIRRRRTLDT